MKSNQKELEELKEKRKRKHKKEKKEQLDNIEDTKDEIINDTKERKRKKSKNKKILITILITLLAILILTLLYYVKQEKEEEKRLEKIRQEQELVETITSYYNEFVKSKENTKIYNEKEEEIAIFNNVEFSLEETTIDKNTKYFKLKDYEDSYVKYEDVIVIDSLSTYDTRYKNYIVFNENIITNDKTTLYDEEDNIIYEFYQSLELPIIIKETDKYGIEFNNRLLYVKKEDVKETKYNKNTDKNNSSGVAVLNYHAFYDETNYEERIACNTAICHSKAQFKTHLDYLKEHNIFTLTAKEIEMYVDGKLQLPKSVYITIDDGPKTAHAVDMLTEYKMNATIFIVTNWIDEPSYYKTEYIELHSHTHDLHSGGHCPGGQGSGLKCLSRETILLDLKQSRQELGGSTVFCYPFYEYNNYTIELLKEAGFTIAFAGEYGDMLVKVGMDKFRLPRFVIMTTTTMWSIDQYFNSIKS